MAKRIIKQYHDFKFHTLFTEGWSCTDIEIDGKLLSGVTHAEIVFDPNCIPIVKLEIIPNELTIEAEKDIDLPFVEVEKDGENR